jgi:hypothetical protein
LSDKERVMIFESVHLWNEKAYWRLRATIDQTYPKGQYVAIHQGNIVADAADAATLQQTLLAQGRNPEEALVVRAGRDRFLDYLETLPEERRVNELAYRELRPTIDKTYPKGHCVAIYNGEIVADAPSFSELFRKLAEMRMNPREGLVAQAGDETPEYGVILM